MALILAGARPPLQEVAKLGAKATQVYAVLWESALMDVDKDRRTYLPWSERRDCGGTTHWSKSALASHIGSKRETVTKAIGTLLDNGFITIIGMTPSQKGSPHFVYRVLHPLEIQHQCYLISLFNELPSERFKHYGSSKFKDTQERWADESADWADWDGWDNEKRGMVLEVE